MLRGVIVVLICLCGSFGHSCARGEEVSVSLATVRDPGPNKIDEPIRKEYSTEQATDFLDSASLHWQKQRKCFTCHTNFAYLYARPSLKTNPAAHVEVRRFAEDLVRQRWRDKGPRWDAEVIATAAALAYNDSATTGKLHETTRIALDRMWTVQRDDGGWDWLKCNWPPMESDDHYGATLAAIATGVAPDEYRQSSAAKVGIENLMSYLRNNPPPTLHHQAMLVWASSYEMELITSTAKESTIKLLLELQRPDGGWATASLGNWERGDGKAQDVETSDGYGTGFVLFVLRRAGTPMSDTSLQRGVAWLKSHQRESGRWFTRSLYKDNKHYLTHAGSAFAIMALDACQSL